MSLPLPDVDHRPGCLGTRTQRYPMGQRATGEDVWRLWCPDCGAELLLVNGHRGSPPRREAKARRPMTAHARDVLRKLPQVRAELKSRSQQETKTAIATGLGIDRNTLYAWIAQGWMIWPPG